MASGGQVNSRMGAMGIGLIDAWQGLAALGAAVDSPRRPAVVVFWPVRWEVMLGQGSRARAQYARSARAIRAQACVLFFSFLLRFLTCSKTYVGFPVVSHRKTNITCLL